MRDPAVCDRYARALFRLADSRNELPKIESDFELVCRALSGEAALARIWNNPFIADTEKIRLLDQIFSGRISKTLLDFLSVLIEKKRFGSVQSIREEYHRLFEKKQGHQEVFVITAVDLSEGNRNELLRVLKNKLRSEVHLICRTDSKLIGGLVVRFNGSEIDASYRTDLMEMRQKLMV